VISDLDVEGSLRQFVLLSPVKWILTVQEVSLSPVRGKLCSVKRSGVLFYALLG
jgi:hypothetical protein